MQKAVDESDQVISECKVLMQKYEESDRRITAMIADFEQRIDRMENKTAKISASADALPDLLHALCIAKQQKVVMTDVQAFQDDDGGVIKLQISFPKELKWIVEALK